MKLGLRLGLSLSVRLLIPELWREKITPTARLLVEQQGLFWVGSIDALSLKSESTFLVRNCLFKFSWYWAISLATQNPTSLPLKWSNSISRLGGHKNLWGPLHTTFCGKNWQCCGKYDADGENIMKVWKGYTIEDAIVVRKKQWKPSSSKQ